MVSIALDREEIKSLSDAWLKLFDAILNGKNFEDLPEKILEPLKNMNDLLTNLLFEPSITSYQRKL